MVFLVESVSLVSVGSSLLERLQAMLGSGEKGENSGTSGLLLMDIRLATRHMQ